VVNFRDPDPPRGLHVEVEYPAQLVDVERLERTLRTAAADQGFEIEYLAVVLADEATVHELNRTYLGHDYPTDVVSFPLEEDAVARKVVNGEVYVDCDMAAARAPEFDAAPEQEALRYAVHGLLHLMGFSDEDENARRQMRQLEDRYVGNS